MRPADKEDRGIWLLRLVFPNYLDTGEHRFPPSLKVVEQAGEGDARGISVYNMSLCETVREAFEHSEQARGIKPVYAVAITVGQCDDTGAKAWFDENEGDSHEYHASIKLNGDKISKTDQKDKLYEIFVANGEILRNGSLPETSSH